MAKKKKKRNYRKYASQFEGRIASDLLSKGIDFEYEATTVEYLKVHSYRPDFRLPNGIFVEVKGRFRPEDRAKHLLIRKQHPEIDIRFVFMRDNLLSPRSRTRYSRWCEIHSFKYALGSVPDEWHEEPKSKE